MRQRRAGPSVRTRAVRCRPPVDSPLRKSEPRPGRPSDTVTGVETARGARADVLLELLVRCTSRLWGQLPSDVLGECQLRALCASTECCLYTHESLLILHTLLSIINLSAGPFKRSVTASCPRRTLLYFIKMFQVRVSICRIHRAALRCQLAQRHRECRTYKHVLISRLS